MPEAACGLSGLHACPGPQALHATARSCFQRHESADVSGLQITKVVIPPPKEGKARDYAFVHFADSSVVARLIEDCERGEKPQLEGAPLEV